MCLLVEQTTTTNFSDEFLTDVYTKNKDGIGIMFAEAGQVIVKKLLPQNAAEFIEFYRQYAEGRNCIWHARMQTHGDIDLENCHPYMVTESIWMAHNGILSSGNDNDKTKSDTWHFIRNILQPVLAYEPDRILNPEYQAFLGSLIGGTNKFGFMTRHGDTVIINRDSGIEYNDAWLSNTYAWSPSKFGVKTAYSGTYYGNRWGNYYDSYDWDAGYSYDKGSPKSAKQTSITVKHDTKQTIKPIVKAAYNSWLNNNLEQWVVDAPWKASALLAYCYENDSQEIEDIVTDDPATAAQWVYELFENDGLSPFNLA